MSEAIRKGISRRLVWGSALALPVVVSLVDAAVRSAIWPHLRTTARVNWLAGIALAIVLWMLLFEVARDPRRAVRVTALVALGLVAGFGIGGQLYVRGRTHGYINRDAVVLSLRWPGIIGEHMVDDAARIALFVLVPAIAVPALAIVRARRLGPVGRRTRLVRFGAAGAFLLTAFLPLYQRGFQCLPPDVLVVHAAGGLALHAVGLAPEPRTLPAGRHDALPPAPAISPEAPSVVLVFGESTRRDEVCVAREPGCTKNPALDAAAPDRIGYRNAYSSASCTEISSVALFAGLPSTSGTAAVARAPLLWDYAKGRGYRTGYFASHNLGFANLGLFLDTSRIDERREARDRAEAPDMDVGTPDERTLAEALAFVRGGGPSFTVVHLANTHSPYREPESPGPYQPTRAEGGVDAVGAMRNRYRNALALEDRFLGDFLRALRADPSGRRAIVLFVSDHGEAWGEHGAMGHTYDLYEEEIAVPLFVDAPAGSLPSDVLAHMRADAPSRSVAEPDVSATIVDLLGGFDVPSWRAATSHLAGTSLLRPVDDARSVVLWNCPPYNECTSDSFAVRHGAMKLQWLGKEMRFVCHDLDADPIEKVELPVERCLGLKQVADVAFGPHGGV